jgi:hypothetical protein
MRTLKRSIACFCENVFEADMPETVDVASEPGVVDSVLAGDFMAVNCPLCGKRLSPEFPCLFTGLSGDREIFFVPEEDRVAYLLGKLSYDIGQPWRVTIGFRELAEKLRIVVQGLDDRVVEIMKYYLITRPQRPAEGDEPHGPEPAAEAEVMVTYGGEESDRLTFHVSGLREGEVGVAHLGRDIYKKIQADIEKRVSADPFRDFCTPPHVSVRRITAGEAGL